MQRKIIEICLFLLYIVSPILVVRPLAKAKESLDTNLILDFIFLYLLLLLIIGIVVISIAVGYKYRKIIKNFVINLLTK